MMILMMLQEAARAAAEPGIEGIITQAVMALKLGVETFGALIIGIGAVIAAFQTVRALFSRQGGDYYRIRLNLARFLAVALEFQLGADILGTAISPSWDQIGKLGAIAVLRTVLNFFLKREIKEEEEGSESAVAAKGNAAPSPG